METNDELERMLRAFDRDRSYRTRRLLKENELERTELVEDAAGARFIRKYITIDPDKVHPYERLVGVDCPYLQRVHEAARLGDKLVVVCEYVEGLDLRQFVQAFGPMGAQAACGYAADICEALAVLHGMSGGAIVHRDINPGNIVVAHGKAVLIDLGIARVFRDAASKDTHAWGTSGYAAPEQFGFMQTDPRTDIYGLGMCLRFMCTAAAADDARAVVPAQVAGVVERATRMDPQDRYVDARELHEALREALGRAGAGSQAQPQPQTDAWNRGYADGWEFADGQWRRAGGHAAESAAAQQAPAGGDSGGSGGAGGPGGRTIVTPARVEEFVTGATLRYPSLKTLWHFWQAFAVLFSLLAFIALFMGVLDTKPLGRKIAYATLWPMGFIVPLLTSANFLNVNDRIPWFRTYRHFKLVALWVVLWVVWVALVSIMIVAGLEIAE